MIRHYQIRISGRVQGVGFRYAARNQARALNLKGWVENHPDGSVLTAVQGNEKDCGSYIRWCRSGTGYSWVEGIEITEKDLTHFKGFDIRY